MKAQDPVQIVEVAARDGFQAVKPFIPTHTKIAVVEALMEAKFLSAQRLPVRALGDSLRSLFSLRP